MSRNALAALGAALLVLFSLPATATAKNPNSALNGVYRVQYTANELVALGTSAQYAKGNYGVSTLRLANGSYRYKNSRSAFGCSGPFSVSGTTITFDFNVPHCHGIVKAAWTLQPSALRFRVMVASDPGDAKLFSSKPWKKIG